MLTADHHLHAIDAFDVHVSAIGDDEWVLPVPSCPGWDVRALVTHVAASTLTTGFLLMGDDADGADAQVDTLVSSDHPCASWRRAAAHTRCVLDQAWLGREIVRTSGPVDAADLIAESCCELVVHTWDLAIAIGEDPLIGEVMASACTGWFGTVEDQWRARGAIGPRTDVTGDAGPLAVLLARAGREPDWVAR